MRRLQTSADRLAADDTPRPLGHPFKRFRKHRRPRQWCCKDLHRRPPIPIPPVLPRRDAIRLAMPPRRKRYPDKPLPGFQLGPVSHPGRRDVVAPARLVHRDIGKAESLGQLSDRFRPHQVVELLSREFMHLHLPSLFQRALLAHGSKNTQTGSHGSSTEPFRLDTA